MRCERMAIAERGVGACASVQSNLPPDVYRHRAYGELAVLLGTWAVLGALLGLSVNAVMRGEDRLARLLRVALASASMFLLLARLARITG